MVDVQSWGQSLVLTIRTTPGYLELQEEIVNISQTWRKLCQTIFIIVLKQRCPLIDLVSVSVKSSGAAVTLCQINSHDKPCRQLACMHVYRMYSTLAHRNTGDFLFLNDLPQTCVYVRIPILMIFLNQILQKLVLIVLLFIN